MKKFEYKIESMKRTPELDPSGRAGAIAADSSTFTADDAPEEILETLDMHVKFVQVKYRDEGGYWPYCAYTRQSLKWIRITYGLFESSTEVH